MHVAEQTIGRLSLYRRLLERALADGVRNIYSHQLAESARVTPAQVRRDLMAVGYSGSTRHGYDVAALIQAIGQRLDDPAGADAAILIGVGNLGRALLAYFAGRDPRLSIAAAFDVDPNLTDRVIHGCRVYPLGSLGDVIRERGIRIAVIAVPASQAQRVADLAVAAGATGLLNFAPARLRTPRGVYMSDVDLTMSLEKVAYFARHIQEFVRREGARA